MDYRYVEIGDTRLTSDMRVVDDGPSTLFFKPENDAQTMDGADIVIPCPLNPRGEFMAVLAQETWIWTNDKEYANAHRPASSQV